MNKTFSIAIDGPAGAGKSSVAKALAAQLGAMYLDTGAMYRAFGLAMLRAGVDIHDHDAVAAHADSVVIDVDYVDGGQRICLAGKDVTDAIRTPQVSEAASAISAVAEVRRRMVALQQQIAEGHDVIMDGRDIGTNVLKDAEVKIYLTASAEERADRRFRELQEKGETQTYEEVLEDIRQRDHQDMTRKLNPLQKAEDAVELDTTGMTIDEVVARVKEIAFGK